MAPAGISTANDSAMKSRPSANFAGTEGSRRPRRSHSHANTGARMMTNVGCTAWNQDDGNEKPKTSVRV